MRALPLPLVVAVTLLGLAALLGGLVRAGLTWRRHHDPDVGLIYAAGALIISPWLVETLAHLM